MMRIVSIEVRRSTLFYAVVPIVGLWLWVTLSRVANWRGSWLSATSYASSGTALTVVIYCACVGLDAARRSRCRLDANIRASSRGSIQVAIPRLLATYFLTAVPVLAVAFVVWLMNRGYASGPFVGRDQILFALYSLLFAVALSGLAGVFTSTQIFGAIWGIAVGGLTSFFGEIPLSTAQDISLASNRLWLIAILALLALCAVLVLPAAAVTFHDSRRLQMVRLAAGVTSLATLAVMINGPQLLGPLRVEKPPPSNPACTTVSPAVCVWPDHKTYLGQLSEFARRAKAAATPALPVPRKFKEFGLEPGRDATYAFLIQDRTPIGLWVSAGGMADSMLNAAVLPYYCDPADQPTAERRTLLTANVEYWLRSRIFGAAEPPGEHGEGAPDTRQAQAVLRLNETAQRDWAQKAILQLRSLPCAAEENSS